MAYLVIHRAFHLVAYLIHHLICLMENQVYELVGNQARRQDSYLVFHPIAHLGWQVHVRSLRW